MECNRVDLFNGLPDKIIRFEGDSPFLYLVHFYVVEARKGKRTAQAGEKAA